MAATINSTTVAYATQAEFLKFFDANLAGDLVSDLGIRVDLSASGPDPSDAVLAFHLLRATGKIESACVKADLYDPVDLATLAAMNPPTASTALLKWMTCSLALITLRNRRGVLEEADLPFQKHVEDFLEDISAGRDVFGFAESETAGIPSTYIKSIQDDLNLGLLTNNIRQWGWIAPQNNGLPGGSIR